jgi:hypothetical protein
MAESMATALNTIRDSSANVNAARNSLFRLAGYMPGKAKAGKKAVE